MPRFIASLVFLFVYFSFPQKALAAWHEVSSNHFLLYSDQSKAAAQEYAIRLEQFHCALALRFGLKDCQPVSPSNRLVVYVLKNEKAVTELHGGGDKSEYVRAFYLPRAGGPIAFVSRLRRVDTVGSIRVLLHEYAHHFMYSVSDSAYPLWFREGFAEFYSTARFVAGGGVGLGHPATHRVYDDAHAKKVPVEYLLDTGRYRANKSKRYDEFYAKSWLLFHMLQFDSNRAGELSDYLALLRDGAHEIVAAEKAFGDFEQLERDINTYRRKSRMAALMIDDKYIDIGDIAVRKMDKAEGAIMPVVIRSKRGVDEQSAEEVLALAEEVAQKYPLHPAVQEALAEARIDAGDYDGALAAANLAIDEDPGRVNARIQKAYALWRLAEAAEDPAADWAKLQDYTLRLVELLPNHPLALRENYLSFIRQDYAVPQDVATGLDHAYNLAPFDVDLRMMAGIQQFNDQRFAQAVRTLAPLAVDSHHEELAEQAQDIIGRASAILDSEAEPEFSD